MANITLKYNPISSIGFVTCNVPDDVMSVIRDEIQEIQKEDFKNGNPHNAHLVGSIEHEYSMLQCVPILNKFFNHVLPEYWKLNNKPEIGNVPYQIDIRQNSKHAIWVNFQKKYEFNALHHHTGVLSFILYIKIPYNVKEEIAQPHVKKQKSPWIPGITFVTPSLDRAFDNSLQITTVPLDEEWENKMIIFPAWMDHQVTPFYTSDEYRISVAGNLVPVNNG